MDEVCLGLREGRWSVDIYPVEYLSGHIGKGDLLGEKP